MLGSLQWLGEFQILACIPLSQEVPIKDVANLSNVPEKQLAQIIRLTAKCGFLGEPKRGYVAHTPLSACFVAHPSHLDAAMFLAEHAAPAALKLASATQEFEDSQESNETAFNLAAKTETQFAVAREQSPRLGRQWAAFLQHAGGLPEDHAVAEAIAKLNWSNINKAGGQVVEVSATSKSRLACIYAAAGSSASQLLQHTLTPSLSFSFLVFFFCCCCSCFSMTCLSQPTCINH